MNAKLVGGITDSGMETHIPCPTGNYDTICGIDINDPTVGHYPVEAGDVVTCDECKRLWLHFKKFRGKDLGL